MIEQSFTAKYGSQIEKDFVKAAHLNDNAVGEFLLSDVYRTWMAAHRKEELFQAFSKHWCGEVYTGPKTHFYGDIEKTISDFQ